MKKLVLNCLLCFCFSLGLNATETDILEFDCFDQALMVGQQAYAAGYDVEASTWFMNVAYALCEGYSMEDINM